MCMARGGVGGEGGEWMRGLGLDFTDPVVTGGVLDMVLCFGCGGVCGIGGELVGDSLRIWQVKVSVHCAWRIPAHLRCTQFSILLHVMDICCLTCICF